MAATVSPNLTDISLADATTGFSGTSGGLDSQVYVQGSGSYTYQTGKNSIEAATFTPAASIDMSAAGTHLYWWMRCDVMPFCETKVTGTAAPSGLMVRIESSASDYEEWHVAGSDTWRGEFRSFVIDINHTGTERYLTAGTLNRAAVTKITWTTDNSNSGTIRIIDNTWLDAIRFGTGLTAYGTDFGYGDIEAIDQDSANMYGVIEEIDGVYFVQGTIIIDDNAGTTTFNSTAETLAFRDNPIGANLYKLSFTGSGNTTVLSGLSVLSSGAVTNTRYDFDASGTVGSFTMSGSNLNRGALIDFKSGQTVTTTVFNNCLQLDPSTSTFNTNTLSNYTGTEGGALLWPGGSSCTSCNFINNDYSIEVTQVVDQTFNGHTFDDSAGNYDVGLSGGTSINIAKTAGSNPNSYFDITVSGDTVTFTANFDHTLTGMAENTEVTYVKQSDGSVLYHVEDVSATGTTTYTHSGGDLVDVLIYHIDYTPELSNILDLTMPNADSSSGITQFADSFYLNP